MKEIQELVFEPFDGDGLHLEPDYDTAEWVVEFDDIPNP